MPIDQNAARERIAAACLAGMLSNCENWGGDDHCRTLAEIACDYADALLRELRRRQVEETR